jgi:hypothetical protein
MKYFFLTCLLSGQFLLSSAQKQFEGEIIYKISYPTAEKGKKTEETEVRVLFAPGRMLLHYKNGDGFQNNETILFRLDSGKIYTVFKEDKNYVVRNMILDTAAVPPPKKIAGYDVKPNRYLNEIGQMSAMLRGYATLYTSDDLYYDTPERYLPNSDMFFVYKNHILLEMICPMGNPFAFFGGDDSALGEIRITATSVRPMKINDADMNIPVDYVKIDKKSNRWLSDTTYVYPDTITGMTDTVEVRADTAIRREQFIKPKPVKPPVKSKPKTTTKTKQSIRKPE